MAFDISIPFFSVRLRLISGGHLLMPALDSEVVRINALPEILAGKYAEQFQRMVLNKGDFIALLNEYQGGDFYSAKVAVAFKAAKDRMSYPAFELEFDYFFKPSPGGYWAIVPHLGVEGYGEDMEELEKMLVDAIKLDFSRNRRLTAVQHIVSAIWFDFIELQRHDMQFNIPTLSEYEKQADQIEESFLPKVANKLEVEQRQVYGRNKELQQFERALKATFHKSVLLVGTSGVGKTALVWEMALHLKEYNIEGVIWETTASNLIKELTGDTGWEDNLSFLCRELATHADILFIRNLLELFEVGQYEGNDISMAEYFRPFVSRGEVTLISECTEEELARIEIRSPNFLSFFQVIRLEEPKGELEEIIIKKVNDLASGRDLQFDQEAIKETIRLHRRFTPYSGMPGKPIRFLESILINQSRKELAISRSEIVRNFCEETGMPAFMVDPEIPMDPALIKAQFNQDLFGQQQAVDSIVNLLASVKTALTRTGKPIASFLFVGPTGVGKTEMAKLLSKFMFGSRERMLRFDMSEYSDTYSVLRLAGEHYFSDGLLTGAVRREPFCVLLFDEIEKAHSSFYDLLLQILSEGRLTDSKGRLVNFCSTIIIMTSNIGASNLQSNRISLHSGPQEGEVSTHFMSAVQKHFRPELYNRIDQVIPFEPLSGKVVRYVVDREIELLRKREGIRFRAMNLSIQDEVLDYLSVKGYDSKYGARQLQRSIRDLLMIPLAEKLNLLDFTDQLVVEVKMEDKKLEISVEADPLGLDLMLEELEKINQADHVSDLRRRIGRLQEGHFYIRLLSRLDILERDKKRLGEKFWTEELRSSEYSYLLKTKGDVANLVKEISLLEEQLSMICMGIIAYDTTFNAAVESWEEKFYLLKLDIYHHLYPQSSQCHLLIYGQMPQHVLAFYEKIFEHKQFEYELQTVWFRERYYNEEVHYTEEEEVNGNKVEVQKKRKREAFIKRSLSGKEEEDFAPEQAADVLFGLEIKLSGPCVFLFLEEEQGLHQWKLSEKEIYNYRIMVSESELRTPRNINRKDFYKGNPRRIIQPLHVKDNRFNINRDVARKKQEQPFIEALDDQFKSRLDVALL